MINTNSLVQGNKLSLSASPSPSSSQDKFTESDLEQLRKVVDQDPLAQLDEQDKELIWKMRYGEVQRRGGALEYSIHASRPSLPFLFLLFLSPSPPPLPLPPPPPPHRNVCLKSFPHSLPKLLQSISWNNPNDVAQVVTRVCINLI